MDIFDDTIFHNLFDIFLSIMVIFLIPLLYFGLKQDTLIQSYVSIETKSLVDEIRSKGYLTKDRYDQYQERLSITGLIYDCELEYKHEIHEPEYRFRTIDEIIEEQNSTYTGNNEYTYRPVQTEVPNVTDPIDNSGLTMNTETNQSIMAGSINTGPAEGHLHTTDCYTGHIHDGKDTRYFIHTHKHTNCIEYIQTHLIFTTCTRCNKEYNAAFAYYYWDEETSSRKLATTYSFYECPDCGGTGTRNTRNLFAYGYSCYYDKDLDGDGWCDKTGFTNTYSYIKSNPQNTGEIKQEYLSGCYKYHSHGYFAEEVYLPYGSYRYRYKSAGYVLSKMTNNRWKNYCRIPKVFRIAFYEEDRNPQYLGVYYVARIIDGELRFDYSGCSGMSYLSVYPSGLTVDELYALNNKTNLANFLKNNPYVSSSTVDIYRDDSYIEIESEQGGLDICTETANTWYAACGKAEDGLLSCNQKVISITPTHPTQAVYLNEPLITTVTLHFQDGSSSVAITTANFSPNSVVNNKVVTLTYDYTLNGVNYIKTATITVTVVPRSTTCVNGHTYNLQGNGIDPGCPFCHAYVKTLTIMHPVSGSISIYKGTTLPDNGVTLLATYMDGHTEYLYHEYSDNLDNQYVGTQEVTISYKGKYVKLTVVTKRNLKLCLICNRYYELYPDGTDPGCPFCLAKKPIFTGNVMTYYTKKYADDILIELYEGKGIYYFADRDYIMLRVHNTSLSLGSQLFSFFVRGMSENNIHTITGGCIREDGMH